MARTLGAVRADLSLAFIEAMIIIVAYTAAMSVRSAEPLGDFPTSWWSRLLIVMPVLILVHIGTNALFGNYGHVWKYASIDEAVRLFGATVTSAVVLVFALVLWRIAGAVGPLPLSVLVIGILLASAGMAAVRFWSRLFAHRRYDELSGLADRALVVGIGEDAVRLARHRSDAKGAVYVVGFLDPSPLPVDTRLKLAGLPVFGHVDQVAELSRQLSIDQVIIAAEDADVLGQRVVDLCMEVDVKLRIVPNMDSLLDGAASGGMRDLELTDLLPRQQVKTDLGAVERLIAGRVVLVTGAGGSIGSELVRQILTFDPARLIALDHDETLLHDAALSSSDDPRLRLELADIRDGARTMAVFGEHRPELVFHAAAHKHVPILENCPSEAAKTNVVGTETVIRAARAVGTAHLVVISTDKAVDPTSVMGASKRVAEMLIQAGADRGEGPRMCAVRFGNVLGSRGSVVPTFSQQIKDGGPVTVSNPDMERYFMTVDEAVQLVLQAAVLSSGGEVFVLDMGQPVRILDLAHRMIRLAGLVPGKHVPIEITGARPGEKITERLSVGALEGTDHEKIYAAQASYPGPERMAEILEQLHRSLTIGDEDGIRDRLLDTARTDSTAVEIDLRSEAGDFTASNGADHSQSLS